MKELSLNILDIAQNSLSAGASEVRIEISQTSDDRFILTITDNGCGMSEEMVKNVTNPFCTSRNTRKVGLGLPLLKLSAEQTGGYIEISSKTKEEYPESHGTIVSAYFNSASIDFTPLGDIISTLIVLIQGNPNVDFVYYHTTPKGCVSLSTSEMRDVLGKEISLSDFEILEWIRGYLTESYNELG